MPRASTKSIRLLAIDLDGTLLGPDRKIVPENVDAVRRATSAGVAVVLASGRIRASIQPFADELLLSGPLICANGAHVIGRGNSELAFHSLPVAARRTVIEFALDRRIQLNAYTRGELFFLQESEWLNLYRSRVRAVQPRMTSVEELLQAELAKILLVGAPEEITALRRALEPLLDPKEARITESEPEYLEFLHPSSNKGDGLRTIACSLGIEQDETAAIGDYLNDMEMLQWAGLSAVVENGADEAKQIATMVVPSNIEAGVAHFIDALLGNWPT